MSLGLSSEHRALLKEAKTFTAWWTWNTFTVLKTPRGLFLLDKVRQSERREAVDVCFLDSATEGRIDFRVRMSSVRELLRLVENAPDKRQPFDTLFGEC
jgi:hypothetical protein